MNQPATTPTRVQQPAPRPATPLTLVSGAPAPANGLVRYLVPDDRRPVIHVAPPGGGESRRTARYADTRVEVHDARAAASAPSLDVEGFELRRVDAPALDFDEDDAVRRHYYPAMAELVRAATGASRVHVFDHNVRVDDGAAGGRRRPPVRIVHNDYTERSAPRRVQDLLPAEAQALLGRRFAVVNAWRPLAGPVLKAPLALVDARSVAPEDLVAADLRYADRVGEIYEVAAGEGHRWAFFPRMQPSEALLIKGYDSATDGRARFTPHTAFDDAATPADAPPRRSIEIRSLVFFD